MARLTSIVATAALAVFATITPEAQAFEPVNGETEFVNLVDGKALTRFGISLAVLPDGRIEGKAFGRTVTGAWEWRDRFFCRELSYGNSNLGANCQVVLRNGDTLRFIADRGVGDTADLTLR